MTFATFTTVARITMAAASVAGLVVGATAPSRADGNLPHVFVRQQETILIPVPECSELRAVLFGRCTADGVFTADCGCAD